MKRFVDTGFQVFEALLVIMLLGLVVIVFTNVVMRYGFNTGIMVTEEVSRFLFVWMVFLGAVVVARNKGHLGVDMFVVALPPHLQRGCHVVVGVLTLACCIVFAWGATRQAMLNVHNYAPISGIPMVWTYAAAAVSGLGLAILTTLQTVQVLLGKPAEPTVESGS